MNRLRAGPYADRHRDNFAPIGGFSLLHSTPANRYTDIVRTLLPHGAHGVIPDMLARDNGAEGMADELKD